MSLITNKTPKVDILGLIKDGKDVTAGQQIRLVVSLSIPAILAQIASIIMQYIDASMVGRLGAANSASIGLMSSSTWLFGSVCMAATIGFSVQVAQQIGARNHEKAGAIFRQALMVILMISLLLACIGMGLSGILPSLLGGAPEIRGNAAVFFLIYSASIPAIALNSLAGSMLQCSGNMKIPAILNVMMCVLDVVFNLFLIFPQRQVQFLQHEFLLPGAGLGVMGAAIGTALAEIVTALAMLFAVCFRNQIFRIRRGDRFFLSREYISRAVKIASPIAFENIVICGALVMSTRIVAPLGTVALSAHSFAITAESLCYMPGFGISAAATTLVGQSIGAGRTDLVKRLARVTVGLGMAVMTFSGILMYLLAPVMMAALSADPSVRALGTEVLRIEAFAEPLYAAAIVTSGALRGAGDTLVPSLMNFSSMWFLRLPLSYVLAGTMGLKGVWIAMCLELCFRGIVLLTRLLRGKWIRKAAAFVDKEVQLEI